LGWMGMGGGGGGGGGVGGGARYVVGEGSVAGPTSRLNAKQPESYVVAENS